MVDIAGNGVDRDIAEVERVRPRYLFEIVIAVSRRRSRPLVQLVVEARDQRAARDAACPLRAIEQLRIICFEVPIATAIEAQRGTEIVGRLPNNGNAADQLPSVRSAEAC